MISTPNSPKCARSFLAEASLLKYPDRDRLLNFISYRLPPNLDLEIGKKLSYRLARYFPNVAVIWHESIFHILAHLDGKIPSLDEWNNALQDIRQQLGIDSGGGKLHQIKNSQPTAKIIALLAREILNVEQPFSVKRIPSDNKAKVCRRARIGYEILSQKDVEYPALSMTIHSPITSVDNLADFIKKHPYRQDLETLLINLEVETLDNNSKAIIVEIVGTISEYRKQLIDKATGGSSRQAIATASDEEPVVAIKFNKRGDKYYYALAALSPLITAKTAEQLELDWGKLTQATKIDYVERQELLTKYKGEANKALSPYGIMLDQSIGKKMSDDDSLFWTPAAPIENTKLEFGQNKIQPYTAILKGLDLLRE